MVTKKPSRIPKDVDAVLDDFAREHDERLQARSSKQIREDIGDYDTQEMEAWLPFIYDAGDR